jgi:hypothetical protein
MRTELRVLAVALLLPACASGGGGPSGVGLGAYEQYQPVLEASLENVTLASEANIAVLHVQLPTEGSRPVLFSVQYPRYDTDPVKFGAGTHRLEPRQRTAAAPPRCQPGAAPTLSGCRPHLPDYPGVQVPSLSGYYSTSARIVIASEQPLDPFSLAEFFIARGRADTQFASAMRGTDNEAAQINLERVLRDRLGATGWAAYYRPES